MFCSLTKEKSLLHAWYDEGEADGSCWVAARDAMLMIDWLEEGSDFLFSFLFEDAFDLACTEDDGACVLVVF